MYAESFELTGKHVQLWILYQISNNKVAGLKGKHATDVDSQSHGKSQVVGERRDVMMTVSGQLRH